MQRPVLFLIAVYQRYLSPFLPVSCRFFPSCSDYCAEAIARFGLCRGVLLTLGRVARCQPFCGGGVDPVPERADPER